MCTRRGNSGHNNHTVSLDISVNESMWKWRSTRSDIGWRPPPGGPIAPRSCAPATQVSRGRHVAMSTTQHEVRSEE